ncbi:MAG TPA: 2-nitropropane dioxygenase, partial [Geobacteraceae bacterium]
KTVLRSSCEAIWSQTRAYFLQRDPRQVERAERDPKHRMALVFRWYLGQAAHWAKDGEAGRQIDYQVWCGPAMGAFNEWGHGSRFAELANRRVADVALNLLHGAAVVQRASSLRCQGAALPPEASRPTPLDPLLIKEYLR